MQRMKERVARSTAWMIQLLGRDVSNKMHIIIVPVIAWARWSLVVALGQETGGMLAIFCTDCCFHGGCVSHEYCSNSLALLTGDQRLCAWQAWKLVPDILRD